METKNLIKMHEDHMMTMGNKPTDELIMREELSSDEGKPFSLLKEIWSKEIGSMNVSLGLF